MPTKGQYCLYNCAGMVYEARVAVVHRNGDLTVLVLSECGCMKLRLACPELSLLW